MLVHNLALPVAGVLCLTHCHANAEEKAKPGLFAMYNGMFPDAKLEKDRQSTTSDWFVPQLTPSQVQYAALDAFTSWAVAVGVRRDGGCKQVCARGGGRRRAGGMAGRSNHTLAAAVAAACQ